MAHRCAFVGCNSEAIGRQLWVVIGGCCIRGDCSAGSEAFGGKVVWVSCVWGMGCCSVGCKCLRYKG